MLTKRNRIALATVIGSTLGAGLFGVPYVFAHAGVMMGTFRTIVIGIIAIILNLLQAEVSLAMPDRLRLPEMMKRILPARRGLIGLFTTCLQYFITIFAYISLAGIFLNVLVGPDYQIHSAITATVYAVLMGGFIYKGIEGIKKYDKIIVAVFLLTLTFLIVYGFTMTTPSNYLVFDNAYRFLPYGVLIYALNSVSSVPLLEDILGKEKKDLPYIIIIGGLFCLCTVLIRGRAVVGVSGMSTSQDALSGLQNFLPGGIVKLSGLVGMLAIISPHLVIGENLYETLKHSFRFRSIDARTTITILPLLAYLYIQSDFVSTIGFSGAIFTGMGCILVGVMNLILHKKDPLKKTYILPRNKFFSYMVIAIFSLGIIYECLKEFVL